MKKIKKTLVLLISLLMLFGLIQSAYAFDINEQEEALDEMDVYISNEITGYEREVMRSVLLNVEPENRENVVYIDENNNVYATSPELRDDLEIINIDGDVITESDNIATSRSTSEPPYRRLTSKTGYSWMAGYVYLPAPGANLNIGANTGDCPYAYVGGTSSYGVEVDAGMMYNPGAQNWALFIKVGGNDIHAYKTRYLAGQTVFLKYFVSSNNNVQVQATGDNEDGDKVTYVKAEPCSGWSTSGSGCSLKRVTSIAQSTVDYNSGSYFKNVEWSDWLIGTSSTNNSAWNASKNSASIVNPSNTYVTVNFVDFANEVVSINLDN